MRDDSTEARQKNTKRSFSTSVHIVDFPKGNSCVLLLYFRSSLFDIPIIFSAFLHNEERDILVIHLANISGDEIFMKPK